MRKQAEIVSQQEKDKALLRKLDELEKRSRCLCEGWAYLRGYYDGMQGKVVTMPGRDDEPAGC